jgi:hypothetical protein
MAQSRFYCFVSFAKKRCETNKYFLHKSNLTGIFLVLAGN